MADEGTSSGDTAVDRHPRRAIAIFLLTVVLGPPIGGVTVLGPLFFTTPKPFLSPADFVAALGGTVLLGYVFGAARAALAGLWIGYRVWQSGRIGYLECVLAALADTLVGTIYLLARVGPDGWVAALILNMFLGVAAIVAALGCRWIAGASGLLPR